MPTLTTYCDLIRTLVKSDDIRCTLRPDMHIENVYATAKGAKALAALGVQTTLVDREDYLPSYLRDYDIEDYRHEFDFRALLEYGAASEFSLRQKRMMDAFEYMRNVPSFEGLDSFEHFKPDGAGNFPEQVCGQLLDTIKELTANGHLRVLKVSGSIQIYLDKEGVEALRKESIITRRVTQIAQNWLPNVDVSNFAMTLSLDDITARLQGGDYDRLEVILASALPPPVKQQQQQR